MKRIFILIAMVTAVSSVKAQTFSEWFFQKKTQIKYLHQQIVALLVLMEDAKKGYNLISHGLHTIGDIKNGEFSLHEAFFSSLQTVNPTIRNCSKVAEIALLQVEIVNDFKKKIGDYKSTGHFSAEELSYLERVYDAVTAACLQDLDDLLVVLTDGELEMRDEERLRRLDAIYDSMKSTSAFTKHFTEHTDVLDLQRVDEQVNIDILKRLHDLK